MKTRGVLTAALLVALVIPLAGRASGAPPPPGDVGFVSTRDGDDELFSMNADGSGQTQITTNALDDSDPNFSPDGRRMFFRSEQTAGGLWQVFVMNRDGSNPVQLTTQNDNYSPDVSTDGRRIAFISNRDGDDEVFVMNPDGSGQTQLTFDSDNDYSPAWSPDGQFIIFYDSTPGDIQRVSANGGAPVNLTTGADYDYRPSYSPDGRQIVFMRNPGGVGDSEVALMNADGSGQVLLTDNALNERAPFFTLDGTRRILFSSNDNGDNDVFVMNADGTGRTNLTNHPANDRGPRAENTVRCKGRPATMSGSRIRETIRGGPDADVISGLGGPDKLVELGGKGILCGEGGKDLLKGGGAKDRLIAGNGRDRLVGAGGKDVLKGGNGKDVLKGGPGRDVLNGGQGIDICIVDGTDRVRNCEIVT